MAHDHHNHADAHHGSTKQYVVGFLLSIVLTIIPFWVVMSGSMTGFAAGMVILVAGILQLLVHLVFFLHLDGSSSSRWNINAGLFTLVVIGIIVAGTLWVMWNMNYFMMH